MPMRWRLNIPQVVGPLKFTVTHAFEHLNGTDPQHHNVDYSIPVYVNRVCADRIGSLQTRCLDAKLKGTTRSRNIAIELRWVGARRNKHAGQTGVIAIQRRNAATNQERIVTVFKATVYAC